MRKLRLYAMAIMILAIACEKENNEPSDENDFDNLIKVTFQNNRLINYKTSNYKTGAITSEIDFKYSDAEIIETRTQNDTFLYAKIIYHLDNGIPKSAHYYSYHDDDDESVEEQEFIYDESKIKIIKRLLSYNIHIQYFSYDENGNLHSDVYSYFSDYTQTYEYHIHEYNYSNIPSKFDPTFISFYALGIKNAYLIESSDWIYEREGGANDTTRLLSFDKFSYELNDAGYISILEREGKDWTSPDTSKTRSKFEYVFE